MLPAKLAALHALTICAALSSFGPLVAAQAPSSGRILCLLTQVFGFGSSLHID